jgi:hypothetical protein
MFGGLPGGSNGGLPIGPIAFWFLIILTVILVIGFVALIIHVVNEIEIESAESTAQLADVSNDLQDFKKNTNKH